MSIKLSIQILIAPIFHYSFARKKIVQDKNSLSWKKLNDEEKFDEVIVLCKT